MLGTQVMHQTKTGHQSSNINVNYLNTQSRESTAIKISQLIQPTTKYNIIIY